MHKLDFQTSKSIFPLKKSCKIKKKKKHQNFLKATVLNSTEKIRAYKKKCLFTHKVYVSHVYLFFSFFIKAKKLLQWMYC